MMNVRRLLIAPLTASCMLVSVLVLCSIPALAAGDANGGGCANEAVRTAQDANALPECRAWELVTPAEKDNVEARLPITGNFEDLQGPEGFVGSVTGESMAWVAEETVPRAKEVVGAETVGSEYLSKRGVDGWTTEDVIPRQSPEDGILCEYIANGIAGYTADLSKGILADGGGQNYKGISGFAEEDCGHNEPSVAPEEPAGFQNLFVRDNSLLSYQLVDLTPSGAIPDDAQFDAGSEDFSHIVFDESAQLTSNAPAGDDLYEWSASGVHLVTILPDGEPVSGSIPWNYGWNGLYLNFPEKSNATEFTHTISADGSRIFFQAEGNLYVREDGRATVQLDASRGSGPGGGGRFMAATADGSKVFFIDEASAGLTADTVAGSGQNLYEYEVSSQDGVSGKLTDLTAAADARVLGLTGTSEDGSYVYFAAEGVLAPGAIAGQPNLYLIHEGAPTFIAALDPATGTRYPNVGDSCDWLAGCLSARVSQNGRYVAFTSIESLTGYDNSPAAPGLCTIEGPSDERCREIFLYEASANKLSCVSCNPTGAAPTGIAVIRTPTPPSLSGLQRVGHLSHNVTDSGQVFFDTLDALVPHDNNGRRDVYEYRDGQLYLLSSGTQAGESFFLDSSEPSGGEPGRDVFFATGQQLVRRDTDTSFDVYDARIEGGFPEQGFQPECADEGCRGLASAPPLLSLPDSASLVSSGNVSAVAIKPAVKSKTKSKPKAKGRLTQCKKRHSKKKRKCVKKSGKSSGRSKRGKK